MPPHSEIVTITTCRFRRRSRATQPPLIQVRQLGGTVGPVTQSIMGDISFRPRASTFSSWNRPAVPLITWWDCRKAHTLSIKMPHRTIDRVVLPSNQAAVQGLVSGGGNPAGTVPLAGFHKYVATIVNRGFKSRMGSACRCRLPIRNHAAPDAPMFTARPRRSCFPARRW